MASLYSMYPDFLDSLIDVAREGGGLGIYLLLTAGNPGSFMFRIAQYVKVSYALQLTDRADYRALVGGSGRQEPGRFPGRGFAKGPLEFQTALCVAGASEGERVKELRALCAAMTEAWKGPKAALDGAPEEIDAGVLVCDKDRAQIGFDKQTGSPFDFVFGEMNGCVISGAPGSGKTNVLGWIVRGFSEDEEAALYIYEKGNVLKNLCGGAKIAHDGETFDAYLSQVAEEYDRRSESGAKGPRIALCIDDFIEFYGEISEESADRLDVVVRYGADYGIYVYIAGDRDGLARFHSFLVKCLESCLAGGNAVALGGRPREHDFFDALRREEEALSEGEGFVIREGKARRVRLAKVPMPNPAGTDAVEEVA
jgi:hypothetical protein